MLRMVTGAGRGCCGHGGWPGGPRLPSCRSAWSGCSVPGARVSCRTVRLYVVINRVLPGAAARPGSRQRAIELVQGAAGLPMVSGELMALRRCGLVPPPGGKLTGTAGCPRSGVISCGRRGGHGGDLAAAMRASHIVRVVITAHSQRSSVAAHAVRACPSASLFPSRPVQRACLAARALLWRSAPQTARQAAARSPAGRGARSASARRSSRRCARTGSARRA